MQSPEYDYRPNWTPLSPITISNYFSLKTINFICLHKREAVAFSERISVCDVHTVDP